MILEDFSLEGQVAIITGTRRGLGQGMALGLAEAGADIVAFDRSDPLETGEAIRALGRRFVHRRVDLLAMSQRELWDQVSAAADEMGRLDILLNNAGMIHRQPALEHSEEGWSDTLQVNLSGMLYLCQGAARLFAEKSYGKIINVASMLSFQGGVNVISYAASKSGVAGLTRGLANEWGPKGINVNAIAPGYMATDLTIALQNDPVRNPQILDRIPAGRWGTSADLKGTAVFLASKASDYVHGTIIPVDGAWLCR
jgi:2-dehydro-3-deoxy-D-gluconate 5-dehydrogenase